MFAGAWVADTVAAAPVEGLLDEAAARLLIARHVVDFAVGKYLAAQPGVEARPAAGDVAHPRQSAFEARDHPPALTLDAARESEPPRCCGGWCLAPRVGGGGVGGADRVTAVVADDDAGAEGAGAGGPFSTARVRVRIEWELR